MIDRSDYSHPATPLKPEERKPIEAYPIGPFRMMKCNEDEVRELEAYTKKLEYGISLALESLEDISNWNGHLIGSNGRDLNRHAKEMTAIIKDILTTDA